MEKASKTRQNDGEARKCEKIEFEGVKRKENRRLKNLLRGKYRVFAQALDREVQSDIDYCCKHYGIGCKDDGKHGIDVVVTPSNVRPEKPEGGYKTDSQIKSKTGELGGDNNMGSSHFGVVFKKAQVMG